MDGEGDSLLLGVRQVKGSRYWMDWLRDDCLGAVGIYGLGAERWVSMCRS